MLSIPRAKGSGSLYSTSTHKTVFYPGVCYVCEWIEGILPHLKPNSVIVMDNASYHSVKLDKAPTSNTKNADIIKWLEDKGEVVDRSMVIPRLLHIVKRLKPLHTMVLTSFLKLIIIVCDDSRHTIASLTPLSSLGHR